MNERQYDMMNPVDGPARRWYVPDVVLLSKVVGIHAILFAILYAIGYLTGFGEATLSWAIVPIVLVPLTLVRSLGLAIRMTRVALLSALVVV